MPFVISNKVTPVNKVSIDSGRRSYCKPHGLLKLNTTIIMSNSYNAKLLKSLWNYILHCISYLYYIHYSTKPTITASL